MSKKDIFNDIIENIRNYTHLSDTKIFSIHWRILLRRQGDHPPFKECITKQRNQAIKKQICFPLFLEFS